jgi:hypothetical protein
MQASPECRNPNAETTSRRILPICITDPVRCSLDRLGEGRASTQVLAFSDVGTSVQATLVSTVDGVAGRAIGLPEEQL